MSTTVFNQNAYGLSQPLINVFPQPIVADRAPTTADKKQIGTTWVYTATPAGVVENLYYVLTSITNNQANWQNLSGGSGSFTNLSVSGTSTFGGEMTLTGTAGIHLSGTGNIAVDNGNIQAPNGTISAAQISTTLAASIGTSLLAGTTVTATTNLIAGNAVVAGSGVVTVNGAGATLGTNPGLSLTSTLNTTQSTGALTIKSTTSNNESNNGFIGFWIGGGVGQAWVPYFTTIG